MYRLSLLVFAALPLLSVSGCTIAADTGCESDDECRTGRICLEGRCADPSEATHQNNTSNNTSNNASNSGTNNSSENNSSENNSSENNNPQNNGSFNNANNGSFNNENNNPQNNVNNNVEPNVALCEDFCNLLLGSCVDRVCDVEPDVRAELDELFEICMFVGFEDDEPGCVDAVNSDPDTEAEVRDLVADLECESEDLHAFRCSELGLGEACGCQSGQSVGDECSGDLDCDGGALEGVCIREDNEPPFPEGYCVSFGCNLDSRRPRPRYDDLCGDENVCVPIGGQNDVTGVCFDGCFAHDECRDEYQCQLVGFDGGFGNFEPLRVCTPACEGSFDCNGNERCNDGRCEFPCTENSGGGGPSGRMRCEALGFECLPADDGQEYCVMP